MKISLNDFKNIDKYVTDLECSSPTYWHENRYLIMSEATFNNIISEIKDQYNLIHTDSQLNMYHGYQILINKELPNGIVDIR